MRRMIEMGNPMASENRGTGRKIPEHEIVIEAARSGGPGGQGVNTAESKAVLRWDIKKSGAFTEEEKVLIRENVSSSLRAGEDEIVIHCSELRKQLANKKLCIERLHDVVNKALVVPEERKETKKSRGVRSRELDSKTKDAKKKQMRGKVDW